MVTKKDLLNEADFLGTLRTILETYEEIAATRMGRIRNAVLGNRVFLLEINEIYQQVKSSYQEQINLIMKRRRITDPSKLSFLKKNGKNLYLFISANTGLYGDIIRRTYDVFLNKFKEKPGDVAILGKVGLEIFVASREKARMTYFEFPDDRIDAVQINKIVNYIIQYEQVLVFYEKFNSVISQIPIITSVSGNPLPWENKGVVAKYFFEPSLEKIMQFFEKEMFSSIFEQTVLESQLAKFASRMISLDAASENTRTKLKQTLFAKNRMKHQEGNRKQLSLFASMKLWYK